MWPNFTATPYPLNSISVEAARAYLAVLPCKEIPSGSSLPVRCGQKAASTPPPRLYFLLFLFITMRRLKSSARKINLLFALELLDESVRLSSIKSSYVGSLTEQAVVEAIRRARQRREPREMKPRHDQMSMHEVAPC
jgi:hypothetical protein